MAPLSLHCVGQSSYEPAQIQARRGADLPFQGKWVQEKKVLMAVIVETGYHGGHQVKCIIEN